MTARCSLSFLPNTILFKFMGGEGNKSFNNFYPQSINISNTEKRKKGQIRKQGLFSFFTNLEEMSIQL